MKSTRCRLILPASLLLAALLSLSGCGPAIQAEDLTKDVPAGTVTERSADDAFSARMADFAVRLFQESRTSSADGGTAEENGLISPLSAMLSLAMAANGADGETLAQMETVLGGEIPLGTLNEYLHTYIQSLSSAEPAKLHLANSIWLRDDPELTVQETFLQTNADYYGASVFRSPFDEQTVRDMNQWAKQNTDGMIDAMINEIEETEMVFLANALTFDAEWETVYDESSVREGAFTALDGTVQQAAMMWSTESKLLRGENASGFLKPYRGGKFLFAALLPDEGVGLEEYIGSMTGESFLETVQNAEAVSVNAAIPKFQYGGEMKLDAPLRAMGLSDAFSGQTADFSQLGKYADMNLYISEILHKTYLAVDERGTRAGAVTRAAISGNSLPEHEICLNRPFVYAIVDGTTGLPVFLGAAASLPDAG
ncbi:MAG TPA: serpin family protein [Firmicutes bacterium]|nr:serpin family protein [Bacillota bacterium]